VTIRGEPLGAGAHPLRIYAVGDEGAALGRASGVAYEIRDFEGKLGGRGGEGGLSRPVVAILRPERAWGGPLTLPKSVQQASESADAVMLFGAPVLLEGSKANWVLHAPGSDRRTLQAAVRKSIHR
jgi:hypothetical protein